MKQKKRKKKVIGIIAIVVVVMAAVVVIRAIAGASGEAGNAGIPVQRYEKQDLSQKINVTGVVESQKVLAVSTDLTCKVSQLNVSLGDYVNEGDVLCVFDDTQIREKIGELEAQASEAEKLAAKQNEIAKRALTQAQDSRTSQVNSAQDGVNKLQNDYNDAVNQYNALKDNGSEEEAAAYTAMKNLESALSEAKNNLDMVKRTADEAVLSAQDTLDINAIAENNNNDVTKALSELYRQLDEVNVKAGQSGIITMLNISEGSIANGILMQIEDNKNLKIKVNIKEKDILKLSKGMKVTITSDALKDKEYAGEIIRVINFSASGNSELGLNAGSTGGYSADISVSDDSELLLGMSAKVSIVTNENGEELSVAYDSIVEDETEAYVYKAVLKEGNKYTVEKVVVTVGKQNDYYTQVTSDRLKEGDLIISYPEMVSDGEEVVILEKQQRNDTVTRK